MSCRSTSRRRTWIISCVSTTFHRSGDHVRADSGSKTTGFHRPPVIGVVAAGLRKSRTSPRIPSRWRTSFTRCSRTRSPSGSATRTSPAKRRLLIAREASPAAQPSAQAKNGRGIERVGDNGFRTAAAVNPAPGNDGSGAASVINPSEATSTGALAGSGCGDALLGERRSGSSQEGPSRLRTGRARRSAKVIVQSR